MKRRFLAVISCLCLIAGTAYTQWSPGGMARPVHILSFTSQLHSFDYKEDFPPPGKSSENGWLFGAGFGYAFRGGASLPLFGSLRLDLSPSGTEYGSNEEIAPGVLRDYTETTTNLFSRVETNLGYSIRQVGGAPLDITPYTGYGWRFWRRSIPNHNNILGYTEDYSWGYIPLGVMAELAVARDWAVGCDVAFRLMIHGSIFIALEPFGNPTLTLGNRPGWLVVVPVTWAPSGGWGGAFSLFYEYSAIEESNRLTVAVGQQRITISEPPSRTHQFGFRLTGFYRFTL